MRKLRGVCLSKIILDGKTKNRVAVTTIATSEGVGCRNLVYDASHLRKLNCSIFIALELFHVPFISIAHQQWQPAPIGQLLSVAPLMIRCGLHSNCICVAHPTARRCRVACSDELTNCADGCRYPLIHRYDCMYSVGTSLLPSAATLHAPD